MLQSILNQLPISNTLCPQLTGHNPTKAELFSQSFNEHVQRLASGESSSPSRNWAMDMAITEINGSFGKVHIAPGLDKEHFTDKIREFRNSIPNMKREFSMMGLELTSVSLIIHEDGSVTYMTWARAKSGGIENRTSHEPYQYDKRLIVSESDSLSDIIKNMAGVLNSAELNLGYRRILELS